MPNTSGGGQRIFRGAVHVQWTEEQLEISSPGGFPSGIRLDNMLVAPPHPRSPLLADAFKRTGLVERTGRGINRMFAEQLRVGRPAPDYGRSSDAHVVAVLPSGPANLPYDGQGQACQEGRAGAGEALAGLARVAAGLAGLGAAAGVAADTVALRGVKRGSATVIAESGDRMRVRRIPGLARASGSAGRRAWTAGF